MAKAANARLKVGSLGSSPALSQPHSRRSVGRPQGVQERRRRRELVDAFGDEGVREPDARMGRGAVAAPLIGKGEAAQVRQRNDFAELPLECAQRRYFLFEHGEELPLEVVENRREIEHADLRSSSHGIVPAITKEYRLAEEVLKEPLKIWHYSDDGGRARHENYPNSDKGK